jgi:hypothetical protein
MNIYYRTSDNVQREMSLDKAKALFPDPMYEGVDFPIKDPLIVPFTDSLIARYFAAMPQKYNPDEPLHIYNPLKQYEWEFWDWSLPHNHFHHDPSVLHSHAREKSEIMAVALWAGNYIVVNRIRDSLYQYRFHLVRTYTYDVSLAIYPGDGVIDLTRVMDAPLVPTSFTEPIFFSTTMFQALYPLIFDDDWYKPGHGYKAGATGKDLMNMPALEARRPFRHWCQPSYQPTDMRDVLCMYKDFGADRYLEVQKDVQRVCAKRKALLQLSQCVGSPFGEDQLSYAGLVRQMSRKYP